MAAIRTQREIRQRAPWWFFGLLALNVALMTYDARDESTKQRRIRTVAQSVAYPIQRGASAVGTSSVDCLAALENFDALPSRISNYALRVEQMQTELRDTRQKAAQVDRLEKLLNLTQTSGYQTVTAQVIARDPSMWFDSVSIDKVDGPASKSTCRW
jgi:cell shape-determining protein MreC